MIVTVAYGLDLGFGSLMHRELTFKVILTFLDTIVSSRASNIWLICTLGSLYKHIHDACTKLFGAIALFSV